ncbi:MULTISPECIES: YwqG family protein [unclassified Microcoleus]|uniref:YwqG family protein n=1 Tax=unclassified Microcoleus TaxID=2642155 RepID=UPI002FD026F9
MNYKLEFPLSPELEKYRDRIEATIKPYIEIKIQNDDRLNLWQSKFGGLPYLPKGFEYPKTPDGKYLFLLAQINFSEVPPLDSFPDRGILQFYIADDGAYGLNLGNPANVDNPALEGRFKIIYFPQPDFTVENMITNYDFLPKPEAFPIDGCCGLQFTKKYAPISTSDYKFTELLGEEIDDLFLNDEIRDEYLEISSPFGHKIGGYPDFTQGDIRRYGSNFDGEKKPDILLFQMDTDENDTVDIMWGDSGIGNFFIDESALRQLDFSKVLYNWDCS